MFTRGSRSVVVDALAGALSGVAASWLMERAQARIMRAGSEGTREREKEAQGDMEPATRRTAEAAAKIVGRSLGHRQKEVGGEIVHYATGAAWGALFGVLARRVPAPVVATGAAYGVLVWLLGDELLVPALGLSRKATAYPASTHAKGLASHLVYGTATDAGFRVLERVLH
jgi:hypothetical protein